MHERERYQKASVVFVGAVALPKDQRSRFVATACGSDPDLEREVRSLLEYHVSNLPERTELTAPQEPRDLSGSVVGRYRVLSNMGRGGMGIVYVAEDPSTGKAVAIKFLDAPLVKSESARRRFLREARAASSLSHPGIAEIYDVGEWEGTPYFAMQLVEGRTIHEHLKNHPYAPAEAVRVALQAARVLAYAHSRGVIHRDISARNILVAHDGSVVLLDFGIALSSFDSSRLSGSDELLGTFLYMAPETILGGDASPESDIFSLAAVLYQMLTGHLPFGLSKAGSDGTDPPPLAPEPPSRLVRGLPKQLDRVIAKALAYDPRRRYASADEFANDLEATFQTGTLVRYPRGASRQPRPRNLRGGTTLGGIVNTLTKWKRRPT